MDERKFDVKSIIGFALIFILLMWFMNNNKPSQEELAKRKPNKNNKQIKLLPILKTMLWQLFNLLI